MTEAAPPDGEPSGLANEAPPGRRQGSTGDAEAVTSSSSVRMSLTPDSSPLAWAGEPRVGAGGGKFARSAALVTSSSSVRMSLTPNPSPFPWRGESRVGTGRKSARSSASVRVMASVKQRSAAMAAGGSGLRSGDAR
ncbi:MAG: hypothetical protein KF716_10790 [Anaerolineae bacterium]|nr:hypothetical protein [Anaerolineae bacterium]